LDFGTALAVAVGTLPLERADGKSGAGDSIVEGRVLETGVSFTNGKVDEQAE